MIIEVCIESLKGLKAAQEFNLDRIEICSHLNEDGLTPKISLQRNAEKKFTNDRYVMIRPHNKGFIYNKKDVTIMKHAISEAYRFNAHGVVFGALNKDKTVDLSTNYELINHAKDLNLYCTFHRAYDYCINPIESFMKIKDLGFDWLLTSGQQQTAEQGITLIKKLISIKGNLKILAGGGISANNCNNFQDIGIDGIHFSIDKGGKIETKKINEIIKNLSIN